MESYNAQLEAVKARRGGPRLMGSWNPMVFQTALARQKLALMPGLTVVVARSPLSHHVT